MIIKLLFLTLCAWIAFMVLPGILAFIAGCMLFVLLGALVVYGLGSIIYLVASTASTVIGGLFTAFLVCAALIALTFVFPVLVVGIIAAGLVVLAVGSLISCAVFGLV